VTTNGRTHTDRITSSMKGVRMNPQKIARITGVLFLITYITSIPAFFVFYAPVLDDPRYIVGAGLPRLQGRARRPRGWLPPDRRRRWEGENAPGLGCLALRARGFVRPRGVLEGPGAVRGGAVDSVRPRVGVAGLRGARRRALALPAREAGFGPGTNGGSKPL